MSTFRLYRYIMWTENLYIVCVRVYLRGGNDEKYNIS